MSTVREKATFPVWELYFNLFNAPKPELTNISKEKKTAFKHEVCPPGLSLFIWRNFCSTLRDRIRYLIEGSVAECHETLRGFGSICVWMHSNWWFVSLIHALFCFYEEVTACSGEENGDVKLYDTYISPVYGSNFFFSFFFCVLCRAFKIFSIWYCAFLRFRLCFPSLENLSLTELINK